MNKLQIQLKKKEKERKEAAGKKAGPASKEDKAKEMAAAQAHQCAVCRLPFMVTAKARALQEHCDSKHPKLKHEECFPELSQMLIDEAAGVGAGGGKKK
mmetsp:Transcript_41860/g.103095  ORF Transcript_41860/g.103095 Transcript_41860/m.103095 type:complete len:99 (+) Transcript_41860:155-451(+)|eukprot:CAMPEP_0197577172 /NCGR_PEP_ID=MMETSP1326-20131121/1902_1 /TAXON_ID=1155430 /ORGANISM="Genus nov. species nov., Strain RCC2288" /LENGTH=98 /DNA_ID=CAMNT_0043140195 /DNA_START=146 /DNA_END=442 /DNA_ORIENTATION=+